MGMMALFQIGENVIYGIHGVCEITGIETKRVDKRVVAYFVLQPIRQPGAKFFVPRDNPAALAKLRRMIDGEAMENLLRSQQIRQNCWIEDENKRKLRYRELIVSGDRESLMQMVYTLHQHKKMMLSLGRKLHQCDENFMVDAQKLLNTEIACVLEIPDKEVPSYLAEILE